MAVTDERHAISQLGEEQGWQHRVNHRADVFTRGDKRVRVIWQGDSRISGAAFEVVVPPPTGRGTSGRGGR